MSTTESVSPDQVSTAVKRILIDESRIRIEPAELKDNEPLKGSVLNVNSLGFVGVLVRLEDELGVELPDNLFTGRTFTTVEDIVAVVSTAAGHDQVTRLR